MKLSRTIVTVAACAALIGCGRSEQASPPDEPAEASAQSSAAPERTAPETSLDADVSEAQSTEPAPDETAAAEPPEAVVPSEPEPAPAPPPPPLPPAAVRPAAFARCQSCHSVEPGAGHGIGPNLVGVMGAQVGSRPGYGYSDAMGNSDQVWTPELMDAFLLAPRDAVPGTKMMAAPIRDEADRQALIEYLAMLR